MILSKIKLNNEIEIKNRIVKSAMSEALADKNNNPTLKHAILYEKWANGGTGLLISGNVMVDRTQLSEPGNVVIDEKTDKEMLRKWAKSGTQNETKFILQLNHPGKQSPKSMSKEPVAPSAISFGEELSSLFNVPRELSNDEVKEIIQKFVRAGKIAKEAGFSGVQIHGAHGYLVNQFLSPSDNQRNDEYGGSLENRMRFLIEIYTGLRRALGKDFIIGIKLNSSDFKENGFTEDESLNVILKLEELGIDFVEISGGSYEKPRFTSIGSEVFFLDFAKKAQSKVSVPIMLTGGFTQLESMEKAIEKDGIAMIGLARPIVMMPDLVNQIQNGSFQKITLPRLTTGFNKLDKKIGSVIGITYYEQQMDRIARGKQAKYSTNAWSPLLTTIFKHGLSSLLPRRVK